MAYTSRIKGNTDRRPQAFWGALIPAAINFVGGLITSSQQAKAQKRALEEQQRLAQQQLDISNQNQLASSLNNYANAQQSYDDKDYNLKYRIGGVKKLGSNGITITDGGNAKRIGNNTFLLRGGSHEDINETGQTGIGINVGGNEIEAEGGEVAQKKNGALRIFSAQPILGNGMSPAQAIMRGYNKDKVFAAQQRFKKNNNINDDGSKATFGNLISMPDIGNRIVEYFTGTGRYASHPVKVTPKTVAKKPIRNGQVGNFKVVNGRRIPNEKPLRRVYPEFDIISMGKGLPVGKAAKATARAAKNEVSYINRISKSRLYSDNPIVNTYATYARRYNLPDKARVPYMIRRVKSDEFPSINNGRITMSGDRFKHTNFTYDRPVVSHRKGKWDTAQQTYLINGRRLVSENKGNWGSIEPSDMFTIKDPKGGLTIPTKDVVLVSGHKGLLTQAKNSGIKTATSPQLQKIEGSITPRGSLGRFNLSGGERRHYNTPYWIDVNNIVKEYGTPKFKDVRLLEELTGLKSGVSKLDKNAIKIINDAKGFNRLSLNEAEQIMNQTYPNGRGVNFINDREAYVTSELPYNNLFYDPATHAEANYVFPKHLGGHCKYRLGGGLTSKDRGSSKHPYPSVSSKDFAGGNRSYPIPTKADAVDALRLAGLHGRSDVRSKVYSKYPELRKKAKFGDWFTSLFNNNTAAPKKTVHFYKSKSGRVFKTIREAAQDNYKYNNNSSYRLVDKAAKYARSLTKQDITIPYIKNKAVTLNKAGRATGARVSTNQLDSIAKYANRAGLSIPTAFGMVMKESTFNNPTVYGTQFIQNRNDGSTSGSWINNHNWNYMRNPYAEAIHAAFRNKKNKTSKDINNQLANGEKYADKLAEKLKTQTFVVGIEDGFRKYKTNPYGYNPKQKDYVKLVNQNARDIMNSPQIQQWYRTSPYAKGKKYKCGGRIIAKRFGGIEHARRRAALGTQSRYGFTGDGQFYYDKNRVSYVDNPYYEMSGTVPEVVVTAPKKTSIDLSTTPYIGRQNTFKPATQDYIGLGIDTLAALGSGMFTHSAYNKMNFDYALPNYVDESPVAFDTIYHNEAQRANVERNRLNSRDLIRGNTSSAQTALGRMQQTDTDAMMELNKLADEKANKEVELRNQNAANEQQVRARNAAARNQYYQNVAQIKNAALEAKNNAALAKAQSIGADLSGLSQAWTNFAGSVEQRYNTRQNEAIIAATSKEPAVLSNALQFGYNFSPEVLASIYRSTNDDKLKQLALSRLSPSDRRRYSLFQ